MDQLQNPVEGNDACWRERCNELISERLKEEATWDSNNWHYSPSRSLEKKSMIFELYQSVQYVKEDKFVSKLLEICSKERLRLSEIFHQETHAGDSLLHVAAHFGAEDIAELIASNFPVLLMRRNIRGDTPLHVASRAGNYNVIKVILSQFAARELNSVGGNEVGENKENEGEELITRLTNANGNTALHEAVSVNHFESVFELFRADEPTAHYPNGSGESPLYMAALSSNRRIVGLLLDSRFVGSSGSYGLSPVHAAGSSGSYGLSPLHAAIFNKRSGLLDMILQKDANLMYVKDEDGRTALHCAAWTNHLNGVRILLNQSFLLAHERDIKGNLPIHLACENAHVDVVKEFINRGGPNIKDLLNFRGQNILHISAYEGHDDVVKYLLRDARLNEATINERDNHGNTALHLASKKSNPEILFLLTQDKRVNVNIKNNDNFTAWDLYWNSPGSKSDLRKFVAMTILSQAGARPSEKTKYRLCDQGKISPEAESQKNEKSPVTDFRKDLINTMMLITILIATVTFAAGFTVPGSVYSSDENDARKRGLAVLANKITFQMFMICNTIAMYSSTTGCIILLWAFFGDRNAAFRSLSYGINMVSLALVTMSLAFMAATRLVVSNVAWLANLITIIAAFFFLLIFVIIILLICPVGSSKPGLRTLSSIILRVLLWYLKVNYNPSPTS